MTDEFSTIRESIVRVLCGSAQGSGTVIHSSSRNSYVLTCHHVIASGGDLSVSWKRGKTWRTARARLHKADEKNDLAILRTSRRLDLPPLQISKDEPEDYTPLLSVSCANDTFGTPSSGFLTFSTDESYFTSGLIVMPGASGGCVTNHDCELVGVIRAVERTGYTPIPVMGFVVPLQHIRKLLGKLANNAAQPE